MALSAAGLTGVIAHAPAGVLVDRLRQARGSVAGSLADGLRLSRDSIVPECAESDGGAGAGR